MVGDVCPKRFGLNYDPPSIILEYSQISTGKLFHRRIGLRRLRVSSDPARVAEKLRQKNRALLAEDRVSFDQIVSLVTRLQEDLAHRDTAASADKALGGEKVGAAIGNRAERIDYHTANLNKLSPEEVLKHKAQMDVVFYKNQKKPGDPDFVYDVQVDFEADASAPNDWDSEEDLDASAGGAEPPGA